MALSHPFLLRAMLTRRQLARNRYRADLPPSKAQSREIAIACIPYGERRKARNRNTIPQMGVGMKKRVIPSTARITGAIVSRKAQISNRNTSKAARGDSARAKGVTNILSGIFIIKIYSILSISIASCPPGDINVANKCYSCTRLIAMAKNCY